MLSVTFELKVEFFLVPKDALSPFCNLIKSEVIHPKIVKTHWVLLIHTACLNVSRFLDRYSYNVNAIMQNMNFGLQAVLTKI